MKIVMNLFFTVIFVFCLSMVYAEADNGINSYPPVVVKTVPESGANAVDPGLSEIKVTFSKDMLTDQMWSWVKVSGTSFPEITGEVKYIDSRTCVAPVKLEPGTAYALWINSDDHKNFKDKNHNAAVPYLLFFQTKDKGM